jgi:hypothetical protein
MAGKNRDFSSCQLWLLSDMQFKPLFINGKYRFHPAPQMPASPAGFNQPMVRFPQLLMNAT